MRFIIDENVRDSARSLLINLGHDVFSIADLAPSLKDTAILKLSVQQKRIIITNDLDFGVLVFYHRLPAYGIILFRLDNETRVRVLSRLESAVTDFAEKLAHHFITVTDNHIRVRRLP